MHIWQKRQFAWSITIVMILVAVFGLGGSKLAGQAEQARQVFYLGVNGDGLSINHDLDRRAEAATNLATVASRYLAASDSLLTDLQAAREQLQQAEDAAAKYAANQQLGQAALAVYDALAGYELSDQDQRYRQSLMDELESANAIIGHDGYNAQAAACNALLSGFPAGLLARVCGIALVAYYR